MLIYSIIPIIIIGLKPVQQMSYSTRTVKLYALTACAKREKEAIFHK